MQGGKVPQGDRSRSQRSRWYSDGGSGVPIFLVFCPHTTYYDSYIMLKTATWEKGRIMDAATVQEIKGFFQEIRELYRETDRKFQETDRKFQETDRKFQETDRKIEETARQMKETDQRLDKKFQETDRKIQATNRQIKETSKRVGALSNRLGEFVEEMVRPGVERLFQERGIDVSMTSRDVSYHNGRDGIEVDLLVRNGTDVVLIECKSKLSQEHVGDHLERLSKFKKYFPEYADKRVMGAVAAMVIPESVEKYACKKGLFVMAQSGEVITILNDENFEPACF